MRGGGGRGVGEGDDGELDEGFRIYVSSNFEV